jgi:RES domain-containing protein
MIRVWRATKRKHIDTAFSGEGARLAGGRFNERGIPLVYTSWTLSLSVLEVLTQLVGYEDLLDYVAIPASFDERHVKVLEIEDLPEDWRSLPAPESTKALGTAWIASQETLALRVPSVILPVEHNYLINPAHPEFAQVEIGIAQELVIDPRLLKG